MSEAEIIDTATLSTGIVIANHMGALDHCRIARSDLLALLNEHNLSDRFLIPEDGETLNL